MVAHLLDAHVLAGKDLAEIDLPALEADPPAVGDGAGPVMKRIGELAEARDRGAGTGGSGSPGTRMPSA